MREITGRLHNEQEATKEFIHNSKSALSRGKVNKPEALSLLAILPRVSKFFEDCDRMAVLADRFDDEEKEYLHKRFKESCREERRR